eukprot:scaffold92061_cov38-Tisochrysis_lutea.AAC.2
MRAAREGCEKSRTVAYALGYINHTYDAARSTRRVAPPVNAHCYWIGNMVVKLGRCQFAYLPGLLAFLVRFVQALTQIFPQA